MKKNYSIKSFLLGLLFSLIGILGLSSCGILLDPFGPQPPPPPHHYRHPAPPPPRHHPAPPPPHHHHHAPPPRHHRQSSDHDQISNHKKRGVISSLFDLEQTYNKRIQIFCIRQDKELFWFPQRKSETKFYFQDHLIVNNNDINMNDKISSLIKPKKQIIDSLLNQMCYNLFVFDCLP